MDERNRYTPVIEQAVKHGIGLLILIAVAVACFLFLIGNAAPASAAETDRALLAQEKAQADALEIEALHQKIAELSEQLAAAEAGEAAAREELDVLREEYQEFAERFGTTYYVVYEVRRTSTLPPSENIVQFTSIVTEETYNSLDKGDVLPSVSDLVRLPANIWGVEWSVSVAHKYDDSNTLE